MAPGADKSPVNQTGMLGLRISTVAHNEDVLCAVSLSLEHCRFKMVNGSGTWFSPSHRVSYTSESDNVFVVDC